MFSIETIDDVKIFRELTKNVDDERIDVIERRLQDLSSLDERITKMSEIIERQNSIIDNLVKNNVTPDKCRDIVFDLLANKSKPKNLTKEKRVSLLKKSENEEFVFTEVMKKKFNKFLVQGNELVHITKINQQMKFPISVIEFLALVEAFKHRKGIFFEKDVKNFCKLYNINKVQFGRIYYNLKEGVFFNLIEEIDKQVRQTSFSIKDGYINIVDGGKVIDTKIDVKTFNNLLNIYVNSKQPFSTIYKLSLENKRINPIHLIAVLRRNENVSKLLV